MKKTFCLALVLFYCFVSYGQVIYGVNSYTEYHPGTLPIVISVPHGGSLTPSSIPDRTCNAPTTTTDSYTILLAKQIDSSLYNKTGKHPHLIYCNLKRTKIDCNREIVEGACGNSEAITTWNELHHFIDTAEGLAQNQYPAKGFYIDLHGHGHTIQQLELGYLYTSTQLGYTDATLNTSNYTAMSSIKNLVAANVNHYTNAEMLRGAYAFGTLLANAGFPAVPSQQTPSPGTDPYFDGGYNTAGYTCHTSGNPANGVQIECNQDVRFTYAARKVFADSLASVLIKYFLIHENLNLLPCAVSTPVITAGGATTFCQGNSVTLTSSAAASYLWSTGATTQSINVTSSGNYTVTVSNGSCSATSTATTVTVNPLPTASVITAGGPTTLCPGGSVLLSGNSTGGTWSVGGGTAATKTATVSGDYFVTTTNSCGSTTSNHIIVTTSSCPLPVNITVTGISGTKATVNWTGSSCAYRYDLQYRKQGNTSWTVKSVSAPTTTKPLTGLSRSTTYEYRLQTVCNSSGSITSGYTAIQTFTTTASRPEGEAVSAIAEPRQLDIRIQPNPVANELSLNFNSDNTAILLEIVNTIGQTVFSKQLYSSDGNFDAQINIEELPGGIYVLLLRTQNEVNQKKFVKE